jgi:hypothetical protein
MIQRALPKEYICARISFEGLGDEIFASTEIFCHAFMELIQESLEYMDVSEEYKKDWFDDQVVSLNKLKRHIKSFAARSAAPPVRPGIFRVRGRTSIPRRLLRYNPNMIPAGAELNYPDGNVYTVSYAGLDF